MFILLIFLGAVGLIASIVILVINSERKKSKLVAGLGILASIILFSIGIAVVPDPVVPDPSIRVPNPVVPDPSIRVPNPVVPDPGIRVPNPRVEQLEFENFTTNSFSLQKPLGWKVYKIGDCSTLGFLLRDPSNSSRQIFYFGNIGQVFLDQRSKELMNVSFSTFSDPCAQKGACFLDFPVVSPFTPENFLKSFDKISKTNFVQANFSVFPAIQNVEVTSSQSVENMLIPGTRTELIRANFTQSGESLQGMFLIGTLDQSIPQNYRLGSAVPAIGITAPAGELEEIYESLLFPLATFKINDAYLQECMKIYGEWGDISFEIWQNKNTSESISMKKYTDSTFGNDRLLDPDTGEVYYGPSSLIDNYSKNPEDYNIKNLEPLPDDSDAWLTPAVPIAGDAEIRVKTGHIFCRHVDMTGFCS